MSATQVHRVVAGLLRRNGRGLLVHRAPTRRWYPDSWDLPGGHIEAGETPREALTRELLEVLGVVATVSGAPLAQVLGPGLRMDIFAVDHWEGEPANLAPEEHDALAWLAPREMAGLKLADPRLIAVFDTGFR